MQGEEVVNDAVGLDERTACVMIDDVIGVGLENDQGHERKADRVRERDKSRLGPAGQNAKHMRQKTRQSDQVGIVQHRGLYGDFFWEDHQEDVLNIVHAPQQADNGEEH